MICCWFCLNWLVLFFLLLLIQCVYLWKFLCNNLTVYKRDHNTLLLTFCWLCYMHVDLNLFNWGKNFYHFHSLWRVHKIFTFHQPTWKNRVSDQPKRACTTDSVCNRIELLVNKRIWFSNYWLPVWFSTAAAMLRIWFSVVVAVDEIAWMDSWAVIIVHAKPAYTRTHRQFPKIQSTFLSVTIALWNFHANWREKSEREK